MTAHWTDRFYWWFLQLIGKYLKENLIASDKNFEKKNMYYFSFWLCRMDGLQMKFKWRKLKCWHKINVKVSLVIFYKNSFCQLNCISHLTTVLFCCHTISQNKFTPCCKHWLFLHLWLSDWLSKQRQAVQIASLIEVCFLHLQWSPSLHCSYCSQQLALTV